MRKRITPTQLKAFDNLCWTYVAAMGFRAPHFGTPKSKLLECESKFGVGHLGDRRFILHDTLIRCDADIDAVYEALRHARVLCDSATIAAQVSDTHSEYWRDLLITRRQLTKWLKRARLTGEKLFSRYPEAVSSDDWILNTCRDVIKNNPYLKRPEDWVTVMKSVLQNMPVEIKTDVLLNDSLMTLKPRSEKLRRDKAGRMSQPWIRRAHAELRAAGVTSIEDRRQLLMAVGLIPYHE
jgi:hypothetical protein